MGRKLAWHCQSWVSITAMKHPDQKQLGHGRVYFGYERVCFMVSKFSMRESQGRSPRQEPGARAEAEAMEEQPDH